MMTQGIQADTITIMIYDMMMIIITIVDSNVLGLLGASAASSPYARASFHYVMRCLEPA